MGYFIALTILNLSLLTLQASTGNKSCLVNNCYCEITSTKVMQIICNQTQKLSVNKNLYVDYSDKELKIKLKGNENLDLMVKNYLFIEFKNKIITLDASSNQNEMKHYLTEMIKIQKLAENETDWMHSYFFHFFPTYAKKPTFSLKKILFLIIS